MQFKEFLTKDAQDAQDATDLNEATDLIPGDNVRADKLVKGKYYFAFHRNGGSHFSDLFKFTGVSDAEQKYGESGPVFDDLKSAKAKYNLKNIKDISNMDSKANGREYGQHLYLCGEFEGGDAGCYYYPFGSSWVRGSGADRLSFYEAVKPASE